MRQWSETPGRITQLPTHKGREGARAKRILVWAQVTSHFTSWKKSKCLLSWHYLQCSEFSDIHPEAEDHHATRNSSMNYVQNLQGSLHNILCSINNFTSVLAVCWSCCLFFCPPHPSNCWLNQREQMLARFFTLAPGINIWLHFVQKRKKKKKLWHITLCKILFKMVHIRNLGDLFLLAL